MAKNHEISVYFSTKAIFMLFHMPHMVVLALSKYLIRDTPLMWHCLLTPASSFSLVISSLVSSLRGCLHDNGVTFIPGRDEKLHRVYIKPCLLGCESYSAVKLMKL